MSTTTVTLTDFLLARFAEDEEVARAATDPDRPGTHWHWVMDATDTPVADGHLQRAQDDGESVSLRTVEEYPTRNGWSLPHFVVQSGEVHGTGGEHIARWDPARVLAECDAKRRIVEREARRRRIKDIVTASSHSSRDEWVSVTTADGETERLLSSEFEQRFTEPADSDILRDLALPYADHPDYRQEYKP